MKLESYIVEEIILEKLRAIITRKEGVHERDIYDLFLLSKRGNNPFIFKHDLIKDKIRQGIGYKSDKEKEKSYILNIRKRLEELEKNLEAEIKSLNLSDYNSEEYKIFFNNIKEFVLSIKFD
jgi:predicted nucleotidyltransferase component of viral defense system